MTNNKSIVHIFVMPFGETELEYVVPLTHTNHTDFINPQGLKVEEKYGAKLCWGHYHFDKPITIATVASFIQELRDSMDTTMYFALKKNGRIWVVDRTGEEDVINTPDGPFKIVMKLDEGGNEAGLTMLKYDRNNEIKNEEVKNEEVNYII